MDFNKIKIPENFKGITLKEWKAMRKNFIFQIKILTIQKEIIK